jgi:hypothetical protein
MGEGGRRIDQDKVITKLWPTLGGGPRDHLSPDRAHDRQEPSSTSKVKRTIMNAISLRSVAECVHDRNLERFRMTQDTSKRSNFPFTGDIEIELVVESLSDHFLISPNDLHRGRGVWAGMTLRGRGLLAALLTMKTGFVMSRKAIDDLDPSLGRKGMNTVIAELKQRGHLVTTRINGGGGKFRWRWQVYQKPVSAAQTMCPSGDDGESTICPSGDDGSDQVKDSVCAGETMGPSTVDGSGHLLRRPVLQEELKEEPPPAPSSPATLYVVQDHDKEEEEAEGEKSDLADAARYVLRRATAGLAPARLPNQEQASRLLDRTIDALRAGWEARDLAVRLGDGDLSQVTSVYAVLSHRLRPENLGDAPGPRVVEARRPHTMSASGSWRDPSGPRTAASEGAREFLRSSAWRSGKRFDSDPATR